MSEILTFMGEHPFLTFFLAAMFSSVATWPFRLINRFIRHRNIVACGWPPPHCDADGDFRSQESAS